MTTPSAPSASPSQPKTDTVTIRRSVFFAALLPIAFTLGLAAGYIFWGLPGSQPAQPQPQAQAQAPAAADAAPTAEQVVRRYDVPVDDDPAIGPQDAAITIVEFSDFECPYCRKWHAEAWPQIQAEFGDQVRLVYRDFPLNNIHANAAPAAEAANCALEQGQYWPFHDKLFNGGQTLGQAAYEQYAAELKLDVDKFKDCLSSRRYQDEVQADFQYAADLGINSTPTFFVNGIPLVGAQPYAVFKQVIQKELAGEYPK